MNIDSCTALEWGMEKFNRIFNDNMIGFKQITCKYNLGLVLETL